MIRVQVLWCLCAAAGLACQDDEPTDEYTPLSVPLPTAVPGAVGPALPTSRRAPPRIAVSSSPARRTKADAGAPRGRGDGVPL